MTPRSTQLRVLMLVPSLEIGGAERQAVAVSLALARRGHEVHLAAFRATGPLAAALEGSGVQLHSLEKSSRWDLTSLARLVRVVTKTRPQIIYGWLLPPNLMSLWAKAWHPRLRTVWSVRDTQALDGALKPLHRILRSIEPHAARLADLVIVNSYAGLALSIKRGYPRRKLLVVPNGIDLEVFKFDPAARQRSRERWGVPEDALVFGILARLDPVKDHVTFLEAAALASRTRADLRFVVVGGGEDAYCSQLRELAARLGLGERIRWAGPTKDVPAALSGFDFACLTSLAEGFPNSVGEAMAVGLTCIVSDVGDCARLVGTTGRVVPPRDPRALAAAWLELASLPSAERRTLQLAAHERITELFGVEAMARATEEALARVLAP